MCLQPAGDVEPGGGLEKNEITEDYSNLITCVINCVVLRVTQFSHLLQSFWGGFGAERRKSNHDL